MSQAAHLFELLSYSQAFPAWHPYQENPPFPSAAAGPAPHFTEPFTQTLPNDWKRLAPVKEREGFGGRKFSRLYSCAVQRSGLLLDFIWVICAIPGPKPETIEAASESEVR
jgi:hypothetical protein